MRRTGWIPVLAVIIAVLGGFATYAADVDPTDRPRWLAAFALRFKDHALALGVVATLLIAGLQALQATLARPAFRRETVQGILDVLVSACTGMPKKNRITLFQKKKGWKAFAIGMWRLKWRYWRPEKRKKLRALWQIEWFADYLYVYARSTQARAQFSTAVFRISDRAEECAGMAGYAWELGFFVKANLPKIRALEMELIQTRTWSEILALPRNNRLRLYVDETGITSVEQLRAMETFAQHFVGHIIRTSQGNWGVLLLDSEEDRCPFEGEEENAGAFGRIFQTHAEALGNILRKG